MSISVPGTYPTKPPSMRFTTRIWHPNVSWKVSMTQNTATCDLAHCTLTLSMPGPQTGEICLDVLSSQWSPAWTLSSACTAVVALLDAPEPDSPLNVDAGTCNVIGRRVHATRFSSPSIAPPRAATVLRTGDTIAYRSMCRMHTALWASAAPA